MSPTRNRYVLDTPIVLKYRPKKKKRSPTLRDSQKVERRLFKAARRTVRAADKGMTAYGKARKKSAAGGRDGALVDFVPNVLKGSAVTMRELSLVPYDLWKAASTRQARRLTRRSIRFMGRLTDNLLDE